MHITLAEGEKVTLSIHPKRHSDGRPGAFASPVTWTAAVSDDGSGVIVDVAADQLSAVIHGKTAGATASIGLSATRLNGVEVTETHTVTVTPPAADDFGAEIGEIVPDEAV